MLRIWVPFAGAPVPVTSTLGVKSLFAVLFWYISALTCAKARRHCWLGITQCKGFYLRQLYFARALWLVFNSQRLLPYQAA
ncbi:hypothetical protein V8J88_21095 [Massilia sp. W12]|uniref:hypothetical protein n=1 Tax=Massilia sp. W12 TaxID=3126507 RepID=UPI0030D4492A